MLASSPHKCVSFRRVSRLPLCRLVERNNLRLLGRSQTAALSTKASETSGWTLKPYYVTTPIFYPNAGISIQCIS